MDGEIDQQEPAIGVVDDQGWKHARKVYNLIVPPHTLFLRAVRALRAVPSGAGTTAIIECAELLRIYRSATCRAILYHAAASFVGPTGTQEAPKSGQELVNRFSPTELASVIAAAYLYRHVARRIAPPIWSNLANDVQLQMEIGYLVGSRIPTLGGGLGMLLGAVRLLGMALFSINHQEAFKEYQQELRLKEKLFDLTFEQTTWNCTHLQVAALLLQGIGFGVEASQGIGAASVAAAGQGESLRWFVMRRWIEALLGSEMAPTEILVIPEFALPGGADELKLLQDEIEAIYLRGPRFDWLSKGALDLDSQVSESIKL